MGVDGGAEGAGAGAAIAEDGLEGGAVEEVLVLGAGEDEAEGVTTEQRGGGEEGIRERGDREAVVDVAGEVLPAVDLEPRARVDTAGSGDVDGRGLTVQETLPPEGSEGIEGGSRSGE